MGKSDNSLCGSIFYNSFCFLFLHNGGNFLPRNQQDEFLWMADFIKTKFSRKQLAHNFLLNKNLGEIYLKMSFRMIFAFIKFSYFFAQCIMKQHFKTVELLPGILPLDFC